MIDITLLGTGGGMPIPQRFLASAILNFKGRKILIDCGEGTQVSMRKYRTGFRSLDIICLTHWHGDHLYGLPGLLSTLGNCNRLDPVTIIGPKGIKQMIDAIIMLTPNLPYPIQIIESTNNSLYLNIDSEGLIVDREPCNHGAQPEIKLCTIELHHRSPCVGYSFYIHRNPRFYPEKAQANNIPIKYWNRLQRGETIKGGERVYKPHMVLGEDRLGIKLSYVTDTRPTEDMLSFVENSDLLICEGTYGQNENLEKAREYKHMTFSEAATIALQSNVKRLWLTHFSPSMDEPELFIDNARNIFPNTILGEDGLRETLNFSNE